MIFRLIFSRIYKIIRMLIKKNALGWNSFCWMNKMRNVETIFPHIVEFWSVDLNVVCFFGWGNSSLILCCIGISWTSDFLQFSKLTFDETNKQQLIGFYSIGIFVIFCYFSFVFVFCTYYIPQKSTITEKRRKIPEHRT